MRDKPRHSWLGYLTYFRSHFLNLSPSEKLLDIPEPLLPMDTLAEAYQRDPDDVRVQDALIQKYAQQFEYAVHEVPSGVLYSANGASVAECEEWQNDLVLFQEVLQRRGLTDKYTDAIRCWNFHFRGYADYLTHRDQYQTYADYISRSWQE